MQKYQIDNVHKRHLFEVYSSADEEIDDVNELQDEYESVSSEEDCVLFVLEVGDVFESWDFAEKQVVYCAKNNGFEVKKFWLEKNKGEIFSGVYRAQKKADIEDTCERESVRMNCPWNINLRLTGDLVYVTSLCNEHNHSLEKKNFVSNHQLSPEILEEIKFLVNIGCGAGPIIRALQKCFPETVIHPKYVYNAICRFWNIQNKSKSDAAKTFEKLMKLQREEHGTVA
uniref:FAR1 domain-containing protein n=1 Tax=Rhizophagus irregularis (strain DAOM 181602 / DAOM 197198 / MUCL 43194) TaxID=747089 RepID=U9SYW2_RHIID